MSAPSKDDVIQLFKTDRSVTSAKNLYNKFPAKSLAFQRSTNRFADTPDNFAKIAYQLGKLVGLTPHQV